MSFIANGTRLKVAGSTSSLASAGTEIMVIKLLGKGTQGHVFQVELSNGTQYALKTYHAQTLKSDPSIVDRVRKLVKIGSPSPNFLWALDFVEMHRVDTNEIVLGYIMDLRPASYINPCLLLNGQVQMDFRYLFIACLNLSKAFSSLHLKGLCYKDVSIGNFFFDPQNGACIVCDIDNICYDNSLDNRGGVLGTPRFMAPEIVDGTSKPTIYSDNHSLAVLIFYLLLIGHPLEGKKESEIRIFDVAAQKFLYGKKAVYVFDLKDDTNRPDPVIHRATIKMATILPDFLMETFNVAFVDGLHDINKRVPDSKWIIELEKLLQSISHCPHCGQEVFTVLAKPIQSARCWDCSTEFTPLIISYANKEFLVGANLDILDENKNILGAVVRHPSNPSVVGLRNKTKNPWVAKTHDNANIEILPDKSIVVGAGITIDVGLGSDRLLEIH